MRNLFRRCVLVLTLGIVRPAQAQIRSADLSKLSPSDFRDDELDLPYYLAHFHRIANSVALSGPRRGFIDIPVWRDLKDNAPYNARIMESILSLAYFYTLDRPWNPYRGDQALRARLEEGHHPDVRLAEQVRMTRNTFLKNIERARKQMDECLKRNGVLEHEAFL